MYLLSVTGPIACKDVRLYDASSCPLTSPAIFYKLREIERIWQPLGLLTTVKPPALRERHDSRPAD